jgi:SsrA-binding protein
MAKSAKRETGKKSDGEPVIVNITRNRRATFDYEVLDAIECGLVLVGTEVKSLREGHASLDEAFGRIDNNNEVWLVNAEIPEYLFGNRLNHKPKRERKLLLRKSEIAKFAGKADQRGYTLVPLRMYFKDGRAKVELAVAKGKQVHDKRESIKSADAKRDIAQAMTRKRKA